MEFLYLIPLKGRPWFKIGITHNLERRIKQHKTKFSELNITQNLSETLYCECKSRHSLKHIETYIKKRFTPVQSTEIFHKNDYNQVKDLIIQYGRPLGISEFMCFEKKKSKDIFKITKKSQTTIQQPSFEFQNNTFMRFRRVLMKLKEVVSLSPPEGKDILKWDVKIDIDEIHKSHRDWLLKKRIRFHIPEEVLGCDRDNNPIIYATPVSSYGRNIECFSLCHPFNYIEKRENKEYVVITHKKCVTFKPLNLEKDRVINLEFDLEYLKIVYTEAFHKLFDLLNDENHSQK